MTSDHTLSATVAGATPTAPTARVAHLEYLDGFRGVAIMFVVMIHANNAMLQRGIERTEDQFSWVWTFFHILSHNSTVYFALISGVLYAYHLHTKPHIAFLRSRFEAVVVPYVLVSALLTVLITGLAAARSGDPPSTAAFAGDLAFNILTGEAWNHLWYIPVIVVLYVISPLLLRGVEDPRAGRPLAVTLVCLPLLVSRTGTDITFSMLVYFAGVYTVGLLIGRDPERVLARLSDHVGVIALIAVIAATAVWLIDWYGLEFLGPTSFRESAIYALRISLAMLILVWLRANFTSLSPVAKTALNQIAAYSFGIYFLHAPLLRPIVKILGLLVPEGNPSWALMIAVIISFLVSLLTTWLIVHVIKFVSGDKSKLLIGS